METEVVTPEPEAIKKMEETEEIGGSQPATLLSKATLVEDVHSKHAEVIESSRGTEKLVATQSLNNGVKIPDNEGQNDNSEKERYLPSLAENRSEVSQDIVGKDTQVSVQTEGLENGSQIQKDQTGEIVEVAGNVTEGNTIYVNGKEAYVSKEQNDDVNVRENLHSESITATLGSYDQQEGKAEDESEAIIDDIDQKGDEQSYDKLSPIVGNSGGLMNGQKEEEETASSSQENTTESKTSSEESELNSEEEITVNNVAAKAFDTEEIIDNNLESTIPLKDEGKQAALQVEEIESNEKSTILDSTVEYHETVAEQQEDKNTEHVVESLPEKTSNEHQTGEAGNNVSLTENTGSQYSKVEEQWSPANTSVAPIDSHEENNNENAIEAETQDKNINNLIENDEIKEEKFPDESKVDKLEIMQKDIQELEPEEMHKDLDHSSVEQVQKGAEIVERHDEGQSDIKEEDCTAKDLITDSNGEQKEKDSDKENYVAEDPKEEVNEELSVIEDEYYEKQDKDDVIEIQERSTEATEDKNEVTEEPVIVGEDNDVGLPLLEQEVVLDHSTVTNGEEPFKNDQEEVKEIEGLSIVGEDKETDKHILDDDAVEDHPEATSDKEPLEDGHDEEKTTESVIVSSDKDIKEPNVEEHIVNNSTDIIEEEPLEDGRDEKEETGVSQVVGTEDTGEDILEDGVIPGHSENSIVVEPFEEGHQDKKALEEPKTPSADQDSKEPIIGEIVSDHSTSNTEDEQVRDGHEESKVSGESELLGKEYTGEAVLEKGDGLYPSETEITEEPVIEEHNEEKKTKELEIAGVGNSTEEPISQEVVPNHSASISLVESVSESYDENSKDLEEIVNVEDIVQDNGNEQVEQESGGLENLDDVEETVVLSHIPDHSETSIKEEATEDGLKDEKETKEIEIAGMEKSISEPITEEVVPDHSMKITDDESVQYSQEEKVGGGSDIDSAEKGSGETIEEADVLPDHSETTIVEDEIKEDNGVEKVSEDLEIVDEDKKTVEPITQDVSISGYSETTLEEPIKYGHEEEKDDVEQKIVGVDKSVSEPIEEVLYNHSTEVLEDKSVNTSHEEKVSGDSELAAIDKDIQEAVQDEDVVPDYAETAIVDEQIEASHTGDKLNEEEVSVEDKSIIEPITKDVISEYSTTVNEDGHEESKVSGGSQVASDETVEATYTEKDTVPDYSETTLKDEPIKGVDDEVKASEGTDIVGEEKSTGEATTEEVAQDHSTDISGDESAKDGHEEKVSGGLVAAVVDTDIGDNVKEEDIFPDRLETPIPKEQIVEVHNEDKVTKEQEIASVSKDIKEPVIEEASFPDYAEDDPEERKVTGESETPGIDNMGEAITEKEISPEDSEATTKEEPIIDDHEEEKVSGEPQIASDEAVEATSVEKDTVPEYSETTVKDEAIEDVDDEVKASEETDVIQGKSIEEPITEEVAQKHSTYVSGDEQAEDSHEEKVSGGLVIAVADKEDNVKEEDVFPDHIETPITEEKIEEEPNVEKVTEELEIPSVSKDVKEPQLEEAALPDYTTTVTKDDPEESKVTGESQTPGIEDMREAITEKEISPEDSGATIIGVHEEEKVNEELETPSAETTRNPILDDVQEKDVVPDYSETTTVDEQIEASHNEDKLNEDQEISAEDESIEEPIITKEFISDYSTTVNEDGHEESKVSGESQVASDETVEAISMEKDTVPDYSETTVKDEPVKDVDEVKKSKETDIVGEEKSIGEAISEEVAQGHSTYISGDEPAEDMREAITEKEISPEDSEETAKEKPIIDGHEEEKVSRELQIASDEAVEATSVENDTVPEYSETIEKDEAIKDVDNEVKASEETGIVEEKSVEEPITEEFARSHSTYVSGDEQAEDSHQEKVSKGLVVAVVDKDIGDNVKEEDVFPDHVETSITEEQIEEEPNVEKLTEELEIASVSKDIKEPQIEDAAFPDYTTTVTKDDPEESKVTGESQTPGAEDMREAITEKEISPDDSEATIIDGHEEEKVNEELETPSADETTRNPILEEVLDHSGTIIENDSNEENIEESKVAEESQIVCEEKNLEEIPCNSEKEKDTEETEKDSTDKDITEGITEEAIVPTCSTITTEDETIEAAPLIQDIQEREIAEGASIETAPLTHVIQEREIADDASITAVPTVSGSEETTKEDSQEDALEPSKHEVEAKDYDWPMEPPAEDKDSTENVKRVDSVEEEENEHQNRDLDNVIETREEEKVSNDISEDHSDTANELNYETADKTEEIEKMHPKDGEDLHEVQETGENEETKEEDEMHQESTELLGETSSLAPFVSEEQTTKEIIEEEKSRNTETVESNDSNITQKLLEDSEIHDAKPEDIVLPEYGGIPKEEVHNVELQEISQEPEITTSQTQEEQKIDEETSLTQQSETGSIKLEETDETDLTELTEQKNIEFEPKLECQDEIYPSVVEDGTITSAENKEVCAEPAVADITEDAESAKEQSPILEDVTSLNDVEETIDVSHEEEKVDSSNPNEEVYEELEVVSAKDDAENLTTDTEQTKVDSQEDDGIETPGEEKQAKDSDSVSTMVETDSTKEREILPSEEKKDPEKSLDDSIAPEIPLEEHTSTERSAEIDTSTKPLVTEEHDIDEVSEKISTSDNHESESSTSLTEKLSLHDQELEPEVKELVDDSDISSKEILSPAIEGNSASSRELTVEDLVHKEDVTTSNVLAAETLVADEVEQKQSEIPEEASAVQDKSIIGDVIEGHLASETYGAKDFEVEGNVKLDKDAEMGVEGTEQKISVSESEPLKHVFEPQAADVVLDSEESIDTNEFTDDNIVEASELDATSMGINRETYALEKNATFAQNDEADSPCEEFLKDTESAEKDHSHEVLPETKKGNGDIINEQSAEDPTVDESIQERINEDKDLQEIEAYLDAKDENLEAMSFENPSDFASQTFDNEKTDQESGLVEKNVELESYLSAGDQKLDELMSPEKSFDLVSQVPTLNNEKFDQDSAVAEKNLEDIIERDMPVQNTEESSQKVEDIIESGILVTNTKEISEDSLEDIIESDIPVKNTEESFEKNVEDVVESDTPMKNNGESYEKNVEDVIKSDIPVKDTEESSENDQKYDEASIAREFNEPTELVHQEKTNDDIPIAPSLEEETSIGDVEGARAEETLQEGKEEDVINKAICESIDDETNESNERTLSDEVAKDLENASDIQNDERQSLGETEAAKESFQEFSTDNANLASLKEGEGKGDKVDVEAAILANDEQVSESNALKSTGDDTYEAKAPDNEILNEEVLEGSDGPFAGHNFGKQETVEGVLEDPKVVEASRESVQLTQQGANVEEEGVKELSTASEPEKLSTGKESVQDLTDDSSNAKETRKNEITHEMLTSHEVVFLEEEIINQEHFTGRPVTFVVKTEQNVPSEETPVLVSKDLEEESVYAPEELTHETLSKAADVEGRIPKDASDTESFINAEKPADCISVPTPTSTVESSPTKGEIPTDNASVSSLTEIPQEDIQEKEGNCNEGEEKQEMTYTKKGTNEESGEEIKREILPVQTSEDMKTSELDLQENSCANEEGESKLSILQETYDAPAAKQISLAADPIKKTEGNGSDSNTDVSSFPIGVTEKSLEEDEIDDVKHGEAQGHDSQLNDAKYNADKELIHFDETVTDVNLSEDGVSSSDVLDKSSHESLQTDGQSEEGIPPQYKRLQSNKELTIEIKDAEKTDQKEKDEEGEEDDDEDNEDHKKDDSGSDAPVMVEASKDIDIKTTPKKSHGILHGVGSKVKHSISKVKKAITGKSSPHKQSSPSSKS